MRGAQDRVRREHLHGVPDPGGSWRRLGLVSHAHLGHGAPTYHLADRHHHIHLVCRDCADVIEADLSVVAEFTEKLRADFGFETDMKHFAIFGRCADCAATKAAADGAAGGVSDGAAGGAVDAGANTSAKDASAKS